jgi:hypothetical protein
MDYPPGFPSRFKPRLEAEILKFKYRYPLAGDAAERIDKTISIYVNMACEAVKSGEWEIGLALDGLKDFARQLCEDHANNMRLDFWTEKDWNESLKRVTWIVTNSIEWCRHLERMAVLAERQSAKSGKASSTNPRQETSDAKIRGERDPIVAARRAELRNMLRSGKRPTALSVCKRWDSQGIKTPESWREEGVETWQQAFQKQTYRSRTKKLISKDSKAIQHPD